jgi:hypothetical protein
MRHTVTFVSTVAAFTGLAIAQPCRAHAQEPVAPLAPLVEPAPSLTPLLPPVEPPSTPAPPAPPPSLRAVWIHVVAGREVTLQLLASDATRWKTICASPCDADVPLDGVYRVVAPGIQSSREVELEAAPDDRVVLDVNVRSNEEHQTAQRLTIAGYIVGAAGLGLEIGALAVNSTSNAEPVLLWAGVGAAVAAITLTITSYVMGLPTGVSQSTTPMSARLPPRSAAQHDEWRRFPVWRADAEGVTVPRMTSVPLVTMTF